jgi:hypothetical protein
MSTVEKPRCHHGLPVFAHMPPRPKRCCRVRIAQARCHRRSFVGGGLPVWPSGSLTRRSQAAASFLALCRIARSTSSRG